MDIENWEAVQMGNVGESVLLDGIVSDCTESFDAVQVVEVEQLSDDMDGVSDPVCVTVLFSNVERQLSTGDRVTVSGEIEENSDSGVYVVAAGVEKRNFEFIWGG